MVGVRAFLERRLNCTPPDTLCGALLLLPAATFLLRHLLTIWHACLLCARLYHTSAMRCMARMAAAVPALRVATLAFSIPPLTLPPPPPYTLQHFLALLYYCRMPVFLLLPPAAYSATTTCICRAHAFPNIPASAFFFFFYLLPLPYPSLPFPTTYYCIPCVTCILYMACL